MPPDGLRDANMPPVFQLWDAEALDREGCDNYALMPR